MKKLLLTALAGALFLAGCESIPEAPEAASDTPTAAPAPVVPAGPPNLAYGKYSKSNNHIYEFTADKAFDGEVLSYWEGGANAYPNDLSVDLGKAQAVAKLVIRLNPKRIWSPRTQTIEVLTSTDGEAFTSAVPAKDYDFDPIDGDNSVTIPMTGAFQHLMLRFTGNTEANAGQVAELQVFAE